MASTAAILQLPEELLIKILTNLLPLQTGVHYSASQHSQSARLATRLCLVSRLFRRLVEALSWRTFPVLPPSTLISDRDRYIILRGTVHSMAPVPVREFVHLVKNLALARHVRSFRCAFINLHDSVGVLAALQGHATTLLGFAQETYGDAFCQFLQDLLAGTSQTEQEHGKSGPRSGHGSELLTIFGLTFAHGVTDVAISVGQNFDKSHLGRFFAFCGNQRKPHVVKAGGSDGGESLGNSKLRAPLSRLRHLDLTDCRERGSITDCDISSLLSFPGLESCLAWSIRFDPDSEPPLPQQAADSRDVPALKYLELADTLIPSQGSDIALERLLCMYPGLETLVLQTHPYNDPTGTNPPTKTYFTGWGDALRAHGGHLRRLDMIPYGRRSETWHELVDSGTLGVMKRHFQQLEALKVPVTRLIWLRELAAAYVFGNHPIFDLGNCLSPGLRYLWLRFPLVVSHQPTRVYGAALMTMLHSSAEKLPLLEWVFAELDPETREPPFSVDDDLPLGWRQEWIGSVPNYLFRRADAVDPTTRHQGKNVLAVKQHPDGWWQDLVNEQLILLSTV